MKYLVINGCLGHLEHEYGHRYETAQGCLWAKLWIRNIWIRTRYKNLNMNKLVHRKGYSLLEIMIVPLIISTLSAMIVFSIQPIFDFLNEVICLSHRRTLLGQYQTMLTLEGLNHSDELFVQFIHEFEDICPNGGSYLYSNGRIICDHHDEYLPEVPFLFILVE